MMRCLTILVIALLLLSCRTAREDIVLPDRGLCAHRGAMATHPENTLPAFFAAIEAGAQMIEFDVGLTRDNRLIVIHDDSVDRTTNGSGLISEMTFAEIRSLDAGSWKSPEFAGVKIPTLEEVLDIMPLNIWLNIHLKGDGAIGGMVAEVVKQKGRLHQSFLACGAGAAENARNLVPEIMICNMDRKPENIDYVNNTIDMGAEFIQLRRSVYPEFAEYTRILRDNGVRINYFGTDDKEMIKTLFDYGIEFPLVDDIVNTSSVMSELGIDPVVPIFEKPSDKNSFIRAFPENPHYLAWGDTPVFPVGPTVYHGWTPISRPNEMDYREQLHRLDRVINEIGSQHIVGFVRCIPYDPMNHMHDGEVSVVLQPWERVEDGRFDLEKFNDEWEKRFRDYLSLANDLRIVVSVEVWDDWSVSRGVGGEWDPGPDGAWNAHAFNPSNNVNYGDEVLPAVTSACNAPFYKTIPAHNNNKTALQLQKRYVDHLISIISDYPNVIINIANESRADLEWSRYWAEYIRENMPAPLMIGDMPSTNRRDGGGECEHEFSPMTLSRDMAYDFADIAQAVSSHEFGGDYERQALEGGMRIYEYRMAMSEAGTEKPLIISKDYTRGPEGGTVVLWSRFASGAASARFHRPAGSDPVSVVEFQHEAAGILGSFIAGVPFWRMYPATDLITEFPDGVGANVLADKGSFYIIQLIGGEDRETLSIDLPVGSWSVRWIDPASGSELSLYDVVSEEGSVDLKIEGDLRHRIIVIKPST